MNAVLEAQRFAMDEKLFRLGLTLDVMRTELAHLMTEMKMTMNEMTVI